MVKGAAVVVDAAAGMPQARISKLPYEMAVQRARQAALSGQPQPAKDALVEQTYQAVLRGWPGGGFPVVALETLRRLATPNPTLASLTQRHGYVRTPKRLEDRR